MKVYPIDMRLGYLIICCLLLSYTGLFAQQLPESLYTVDYTKVKVSKVASDLEAKSGFHFYFDEARIDSVKITAKLNQKPLSLILTAIFENTGIRFVIYQKQVFLTKDKTIKTELAQGYEGTSSALPQKETTAQVTVNADLENQAQKELTAVTANKIYEIGIKSNTIKKGTAVIAGYIRDLRTGEPISGARVSTSDLKTSASSNEQGLYSLSLPYGSQTLMVKADGNRDSKRQIVVYGDGRLNIELKEKIVTLKEVRITGNKANNVKSLEMGVTKVDIKTIKKIPAVFGEPDILRAILTLPGVQSVGEASTGFNVRGGSADQNLILLNEATIYNPSHFFGFFSAFNPEIVKEVELYKSTIPERFGGRLASVLEVINRDGDKQKITGSAGIGLITSRFNIEGPIDSGKTSFIFGGRGTYSNWLLKLLPAAYENSNGSFYDFNLGINHQINEKNNITFSAYYSLDKFKLNSDTNFSYNNRNASIKWKRIMSEKLNGTLVVASDFYEYNIKSDVNPVNAYQLKFNINQSSLKYNMVYALHAKHTLNFGLSSIYYQLNPGNFTPRGNESLVVPDIVPKEQALESAVFIGDQFDVSNDFSVSAGLRYSFYNYLGPQSIRNYAPNLPVTDANLIETVSYGKNKSINSYGGPEIRASARYNFMPNFSVKVAYNTLRQYIHLLSNTTAIAPTDVWKLSDPNIKPQFGSQVSLGLYKNFEKHGLETSVEVYYKKLKDFLDYKSGANLVLNQQIETDLISTKGKAYGIEFLIKKNDGKLNGWMSYAFSRTLLKMDDPTNGPVVNGGNFYPANYDKPHAFNFTGNYRFKHRYHLSLAVTYSTGRPITLPVAKYFYGGSERVFYTDRNASRIPDYFRTDVSFNIEGNHKVHQRTHNSYTIGFYNLTGQKNPYSVYYVQEAGVINGYKLSIFASVIPFINYNIRF